MTINFEVITREELVALGLSLFDDSFDKRPGSVIWDTTAVYAHLLYDAYQLLKIVQDNSFLETAEGDALDKIGWEHGVERIQATYATKRIEIYSVYNGPGAPTNVLNTGVPIGAVFATRDPNNIINYELTELEEAGTYLAVCQTPGRVGNVYAGPVTPITNLTGIAAAIMQGNPVVAAIDTQTDDEYRQSILQGIQNEGFGGNRAAYNHLIRTTFTDIGQFQLYTGPGGRVILSALNVEGQPIDEERLEEIQDYVDPATHHAEGIGWAPVGHQFYATSPTNFEITVEVQNLALNGRLPLEEAQEAIQTEVQSLVQTFIDQWDVLDSDYRYTSILYYQNVVSAVTRAENGVASADVLLNGQQTNMTVPTTVYETVPIQQYPTFNQVIFS